MRGAPIPPADYDGEHLDTDEKLERAGWAAGLDVWEQVGKGYSEQYLGDDTLGNAQLWSLQEAIRSAERVRLAQVVEAADMHEAAELIRSSGQRSTINQRSTLNKPQGQENGS
jgi:hypothetical protein